MPGWMVRAASLFTLLLAAGLAAAQAEWSAVVVDTGKEDAPTTLKIYFGGEKVRLEPQMWVRGSAPGPFILFDRTARTGLVVVPADQAYMEAPSDMIEPYRGFAADWKIDTFCAGWLKTQQNRDGTCKELSDESVNGREALRYEATNSNGAMTRLWFDRKLRMMVKWEAGKNGGEMRNIHEEPQPSAIFEIPAGYTESKMILGTVGSATPKK
jgi:hypothetical protein